jgi:hypothetical protein
MVKEAFGQSFVKF